MYSTCTCTVYALIQGSTVPYLYKLYVKYIYNTPTIITCYTVILKTDLYFQQWLQLL